MAACLGEGQDKLIKLRYLVFIDLSMIFDSKEEI